MNTIEAELLAQIEHTEAALSDLLEQLRRYRLSHGEDEPRPPSVYESRSPEVFRAPRPDEW